MCTHIILNHLHTIRFLLFCNFQEELKRALLQQEKEINRLQLQLTQARSFCQPHLIDEWGPILERRWWDENLSKYLSEIDKLEELKLSIKLKWECRQQKGCASIERQ